MKILPYNHFFRNNLAFLLVFSTSCLLYWEWRHRDKVTGIGQTGFHGNTKSNVLHKPDCKNCTEEFSTTDEAVMAG